MTAVKHVDAGDDLNLLCDAVEVVAKAKLVDGMLIQRRVRVGFAKAGRLIGLLEQAGVIGPLTSGLKHEVLITQDQVPATLAMLRGETR